MHQMITIKTTICIRKAVTNILRTKYIAAVESYQQFHFEKVDGGLSTGITTWFNTKVEDALSTPLLSGDTERFSILQQASSIIQCHICNADVHQFCDILHLHTPCFQYDILTYLSILFVFLTFIL
jgi:hypothetical protein